MACIINNGNDGGLLGCLQTDAVSEALAGSAAGGGRGPRSTSVHALGVGAHLQVLRGGRLLAVPHHLRDLRLRAHLPGSTPPRLARRRCRRCRRNTCCEARNGRLMTSIKLATRWSPVDGDDTLLLQAGSMRLSAGGGGGGSVFELSCFRHCQHCMPQMRMRVTASCSATRCSGCCSRAYCSRGGAGCSAQRQISGTEP